MTFSFQPFRFCDFCDFCVTTICVICEICMTIRIKIRFQHEYYRVFFVILRTKYTYVPIRTARPRSLKRCNSMTMPPCSTGSTLASHVNGDFLYLIAESPLSFLLHFEQTAFVTYCRTHNIPFIDKIEIRYK